MYTQLIIKLCQFISKIAKKDGTEPNPEPTPTPDAPDANNVAEVISETPASTQSTSEELKPIPNPYHIDGPLEAPGK